MTEYDRMALLFKEAGIPHVTEFYLGPQYRDLIIGRTYFRFNGDGSFWGVQQLSQGAKLEYAVHRNESPRYHLRIHDPVEDREKERERLLSLRETQE